MENWGEIKNNISLLFRKKCDIIHKVKKREKYMFNLFYKLSLMCLECLLYQETDLLWVSWYFCAKNRKKRKEFYGKEKIKI